MKNTPEFPFCWELPFVAGSLFHSKWSWQLANDAFVQQFRARGIETQTGSFGADMRVSIENDGPVTLVLSTDEWPTRV